MPHFYDNDVLDCLMREALCVALSQQAGRRIDFEARNDLAKLPAKRTAHSDCRLVDISHLLR